MIDYCLWLPAKQGILRLPSGQVFVIWNLYIEIS